MIASSRIGLSALLLLAAGCNGLSIGTTPDGNSSNASADEVDETAVAGANQNDRSNGKDGEDLQTGAMVVSPSGRFIVMQRNTLTLIYDVANAQYHEIQAPFRRVAFAKGTDTIYAETNGSIQAVDLASRNVLWTLPELGALSLLRIDDADRFLLVGTASDVRVVDASRGIVQSTTPVPAPVSYAAFVPGQSRALVVGKTVWRDKGPHTPVFDVDLTASAAGTSVDVPNCEAPIVVTPNGARAFLSPTYCSPGKQATPGETWTNPDPVSVVDLGAHTAHFDKNLPGFGPVVMSNDGARLVAYLDVKRMDPAMFDDPKQVPWEDGPRYHLMTIDPATLAFRLAPIGNAIPRFAMTNDGSGLLVDASTKFTTRTKVAAKASATIGADGVQTNVQTDLDVFGSSSAFGFFDLGSQSFTAFRGPVAPLDRFVQFANGRYVLTLTKRSDGLGGIPYLVDLGTKTTTPLQGNYGSGVRDVGLTADGSTAFVRLRLPADVRDGSYFSREALCTSTNGECGASLSATYEASTPFATVSTADDDCPGGHDCF